MKALILNSGLGSRMGVLTSEHPKCMTEISPRETIISRQLNQLAEAGIREVVITTGLPAAGCGPVVTPILPASPVKVPSTIKLKVVPEYTAMSRNTLLPAFPVILGAPAIRK